MILSLTGFMGVGKSTIANILSKHLSCKYIDLDHQIEQKAGCSIQEIYSKNGEEYFRKLEEMILAETIERCRSSALTVLSLGGGALLSATNREIIKKECLTIYLKADIQTLHKRLINSNGNKKRPLLESHKDGEALINNLLEKRTLGYEECAVHTVSTDGKTAFEIVKEISTLI